MILALLAAAGLAWWLHREGLLLPNLRRLGVAGGALLLAMRLVATGSVVAGVVVAMTGVAWWRWSAPSKTRRDWAAARALLGIEPTADAGAVNAAWRRRMAEVHPDRGGSAEVAAQITAARDLLLQR